MDVQDQVNKIAGILGKKTTKNHEGRRKPKSVDRHVWTITEEDLALKLYFSGASREEIELAIVNTPIKLSSMLMKISNIKYLDTGDGLENVSATTKALFERHIKNS